MDSYDVIAEKVKDYWKDSYPQDVIAFFQQKYLWDDKWEKCEELVECHGSDDYENMTFLSDFCEGQTDVKDVVIVPLRDVTAFYCAAKIKPLTNADRIRAMTDEELAEWFIRIQYDVSDYYCGGHSCEPTLPTGEESWLGWLKQEASDDNHDD